MNEEVRRALEVLARHASPAPSPKIREVWAKYAEWGIRHRRYWKSCQGPHWHHLAPFWAQREVGSVTMSEVDHYRALRATTGAAPATRNREMSSLRACFNWAMKRGLLTSNPLLGMEQERENNVRTEFIEEHDFHKLLAAAPHPMARVFFTVAFDTGLRRGELCGLLWSQVDIDAHLIRLGDGDVKNGHGRIVPLTDRAVSALNECPRWAPHVFTTPHGRLGLATSDWWFRQARDGAGFSSKLKLHSLRHSCATLMRRRGVPWALIKAALGWRTDIAARRYQQYSSEDWISLREKMNVGIVEEIRKGPARSLPVKQENSPSGNKSLYGKNR